jgi:3-hydroxyisobutyrate dehydrogenase-like beta-hydroxyacid dehydrogenase
MGKDRIGVVGVGFMGHGIAKCLIEAGYPVTVIAHRNRAPVDDLVGRGASEAATLADLAAACDIVHVCAPGSPQVEAIVGDLIPALPKGAVVIDCSTSDPASTAVLAARLAEAGHHMADAPMGGTPVQAEEGMLSAMVGAEEAVFERIEPILRVWAGTKVVRIGGPGDGHRMKLINNFLSMGYGAIYAEALALARKSGLTVAQVDSVIGGSRMDCGFYQTFMGHVRDGDRASHKFTLTNALKDTDYVAAMARATGVANPVGAAVRNAFAMAVAAGGDGPEDYVPHLADFVARANGLDEG